ncbi:MAG: carboxypeptidase-like regulatory domain-containing protein [Crocinitomicaceae bacterium]|nr:carboxypeptidase-like regulatory domain-containing protein [Crocinitomicaceae bacterium]
MKHLFYTALFFLLLMGCKKGQADFVVEGTITDNTFSKALSYATIDVYSVKNNTKTHLLSSSTDSDGKYSLKVKRDRFETLEIEVTKEHYFSIYKSILFDDLSVKNKNQYDFTTTGKAWAKIHLRHLDDNTTKLDLVKSIGKNNCTECCSDSYQQFVGNLDSVFYCVNDANTLYEVTYFKQYSSTNGKKSATTPFMDTVEILVEY